MYICLLHLLASLNGQSVMSHPMEDVSFIVSFQELNASFDKLITFYANRDGCQIHLALCKFGQGVLEQKTLSDYDEFFKTYNLGDLVTESLLIRHIVETAKFLFIPVKVFWFGSWCERRLAISDKCSKTLFRFVTGDSEMDDVTIEDQLAVCEYFAGRAFMHMFKVNPTFRLLERLHVLEKEKNKTGNSFWKYFGDFYWAQDHRGVMWVIANCAEKCSDAIRTKNASGFDRYNQREIRTVLEASGATSFDVDKECPEEMRVYKPDADLHWFVDKVHKLTEKNEAKARKKVAAKSRLIVDVLMKHDTRPLACLFERVRRTRDIVKSAAETNGLVGSQSLRNGEILAAIIVLQTMQHLWRTSVFA